MFTLRWSSALSFCMLSLWLLGCSGGNLRHSPVEPIQDLSASSIGPTNPGQNRLLFGLWDVALSPVTNQFEITPVRLAEFHLNVVKLLNDKPASLSIAVIEPLDILTGEITFDVGIKHPAPNSIFRGFDTRGILLGKGISTLSSKDDPDLMWFNPNGATQLLNPDGYTRWWNPKEFITPGLFGYIPGKLAPDVICDTTLNPYKYFASSLVEIDPVVPNVLDNRGTFSPDENACTRRYELRFPFIDGDYVKKFQYAVDTSWAQPTGGFPVPGPDDFPPSANCPEPFYINVNSGDSTVFYENDSNNGGQVVLDIEVFDWGTAANPDGIDGEISVIEVESPTLFDQVVSLDIDSKPGTSPLSGLYHIVIPSVHPTGLDNQQILITVVSKGLESYKPPIDGPVYPENAFCSAYALVNLQVDTDKIIGFPDTNLEAAIRAALMKPSGDIHQSELLTITQLNGAGYGISNLEGIQYCTNLLNLDLSYNTVTNLTMLQNLIGLTELWMNNNHIYNITPLQNLTGLTELWISNNVIHDITPLEKLTSLTGLQAGGNIISDITVLENLTQLNWLEVGGNQISDISPLAGLTSLTGLGIFYNQISDITPLQNLTGLARLNVGHNDVSDITPLQNLTDIYLLWMGDNQIADITPLQNLTAMSDLELYSNQISDITPLENMTVMYNLELSFNQITDIAPLYGMTEIAFIALSGNEILDIDSLQHLPQLAYIEMANNQIVDLLPLVDNPGMGLGDEVHVQDNPLSEQSINEYIPTLQADGVTVYW